MNPYKPSVFLWDIGKQWKTRSYAAVWSGFTLFAYKMYFYNLNEIETYHPTTLTLEINSSNW